MSQLWKIGISRLPGGKKVAVRCDIAGSLSGHRHTVEREPGVRSIDERLLIRRLCAGPIGSTQESRRFSFVNRPDAGGRLMVAERLLFLGGLCVEFLRGVVELLG